MLAHCHNIASRSVQVESVEERSKALNEAFTYALFINVCRSLFEAHKLMFSFLLAVKILQNRQEIDAGEQLSLHDTRPCAMPIAREPCPWLHVYICLQAVQPHVDNNGFLPLLLIW